MPVDRSHLALDSIYYTLEYVQFTLKYYPVLLTHEIFETQERILFSFHLVILY